MKKILLLSLLTMGLSSFNAQNQDSISVENSTTITEPTIEKQKRNDFIINPIALVLGVGNLSYEYHLNKDSGIGVNMFFIFNNRTIDSFEIPTIILPYYRYYLGKKWAKGFFIDASLGMVSRISERIKYSNSGYYDYVRERHTGVGIAVGLGGKWTLKNNLLLETSLGLGNSFSEGQGVFMKGLFGLGYRF